MTDYSKFYEENCFSLDAKTFSEIKSQIIEYIKDDDCPSDVKIMFGDWLFRKIYMNYKPPSTTRKEVCSDLIGAVDNCDKIVVKSEYLKFHDTIAMSLIAKHFYSNRFSDKDKYFILQLLNDTQLIKNYLQDSSFEGDDLKNHFLSWISEVPIFEQRSNILDVLLKHFPSDPRVKAVYEEMRWGGENSPGSIYRDEQNVHDVSVQQSVTGAANALLMWHKQIIEAGRNLFDMSEAGNAGGPSSVLTLAGIYLTDLYKNNTDKKIAEAIIERTKIDTTQFIGSDYSFTIGDVLIALLHYIEFSEAKEVLTDILLEEMKEMVELCSSGYVARFINVIQGFDERFVVTISPEKQLYAVISHALSTGLEKAPDNVIAGSIDTEHKDEYLSFVSRVINDQMSRMVSDYGKQDVVLYVTEIVERLTGVKCTLDTEALTLKMQ